MQKYIVELVFIFIFPHFYLHFTFLLTLLCVFVIIPLLLFYRFYSFLFY